MEGKLLKPTLRPIRWLGDSRKQVQMFPQSVRQDIGANHYDVQRGVTPPKVKYFSIQIPKGAQNRES